MLVRQPAVWPCLALAVATGCTPVRDFPAPSLSASARVFDAEPAPEERPNVIPANHSTARAAACEPKNVLVLSGGGMNGAYPAGVLNGWSEAGIRPRFDVVTGISAGALIAPFAFLGPGHDDALARNAILHAEDVYRSRSIFAIPWAVSLADSARLCHLIRTEITAEVLEEIAQAHRAGRRLYVGTTNLDTKRPVVWDMGAIAAGDNPKKLDLFQNVLLASSSVPGLFPPVAINVEIDGKKCTELHVDGGVSASLFLQPRMLGVEPGEPPPAPDGCSVYVIVAGKLNPDPAPVRQRLISVSGGAISGLLQAQFDGDLLRVYLLSLYAGANFQLAAIPQEFQLGESSMAFDTTVMRAMFADGRQFGRAGGPWRGVPPGLNPDEWQAPRRGVRLTTHAGSLPPAPSGPGVETEQSLRTWLRGLAK